MTRRRLEVFGAVALCVVLAVYGFARLNVPVRTWEATGVLRLVGLGTGAVTVVAHHTFQVLPATHQHSEPT